MNFVIVSPGMEHTGNTIKEKSLGGSETAAIQLAEALAKAKDPFGGKNRVIVFSPCERPVTVNEVQYLPIQASAEYARGADIDVLIVSRAADFLTHPHNAKVCFLWCHDLALRRTEGQIRGTMYQIDRVLLMSRFQKDQYKEVYGIPDEGIEVIRNGIDLSLFPAPRKSAEKVKGQMVYCARPERGLENLVRPGGIMEQLAKEVPEATLLVAHYDNTVEQMKSYYGMLWSRCNELPNVRLLGSLTKKQLYDLYSRSWLYIYPTPSPVAQTFDEISCLTGDALIDIPRDYRTDPNGVPIRDLVGKSGFPAYCYDSENGRMTLGTVKWVAKTKTDAEVWRLTLDDGSVVRATPEHEIMLRDGTYRPLRDLKPGDSLMPLYKHHRVVVNRNDGTWVDEARLVGEWLAGRPLDGHNEHVHHRLDWWSNAPENLQVLSRSDHFSVTHKGKRRHAIERAKQGAAMLARLAEMTDEEREIYFASRPKAARALWDKVRAMSPGDRSAWLCKRAAKADRKTEKYRAACAKKGSTNLISMWDRINAMPSEERQAWLDQRTEKMAAGRWNHTVVDVRPDGFEDVYDMEVDTHHNFVANGIVVHNCISAMEAQACGLPFLSTARGALNETVAPGTGILIPGDGYDENVQRRFVKEVKRLYHDEIGWQRLSREAYKQGATLGWEPVAERLTLLADEIMAERASDPDRVYKKFLHVSDIEMCREIEKSHPLPLCAKEKEFVRQGWAFTESPEAYREHYKLVDAGATVEHFEQSEGEMRWLTLRDFLRRNKGKIKSVLDYGCWIGHQTIRAANELPEAQFVGVDVTPRNIELAEECKKKHAKQDNVQFRIYDEMSDGPKDGNAYDLVVLNEVLEHVLEPKKLITELEASCKPGGTIFITVPYGPWEAMSYETFPHRCHLRHYEMNDLMDIFGQKKDVQVFYRQVTKNDQGAPCGHHYVIYENDPGRSTGAVNVQRKMRWQAPRETVSVCMIAYNAESMLHRTLKSVRKFADEVIIAVDPKTTDSTRSIAECYGATVIDGLNPMVVGFDEARNNSIAQAKGDWILWIDSDEEMLNPSKIIKYLRPNILNAYGLQQHHLSVDPPMNMKPDLPMRLFRNRKGIRFYGVVHEHPETEMNKGVGYALVLSDTWIAHDGYLTEDVRRSRFLRNIDLVVRDRAKYPDRMLGYFLWLRDLIHLCRYRLEQNNGSGADAQVHGWAREAQRLYEERYLRAQNDPMAPDALSYYSEANRLLGEGIPMQVKLRVGNEGERDFMAQFRTSDAAAEFMANTMKATVGKYEGRYL